MKELWKSFHVQVVLQLRSKIQAKEVKVGVMSHLQKIHVLHQFRPYLQLITRNRHEIGHFSKSWRCILRSICDVLFYCTKMFLSLPAMIILGIWYLIENEADLREAVVSLPLVISLIEIQMIFIAMLMEARTVTETIEQLQRLVDRRESILIVYSCPCCGLFVIL